MYFLNRGVEKDEREAVKWYRKAAEQGYPSAQHNFGLMCVTGTGMERDFLGGYAWLDIANVNGANKAKIAKAKLKMLMTPDQILKAESLTKEMVKKNPKLIKQK